MTPLVRHVSGPLPDRELTAEIFAGRILVFRDLQPVSDLVSLARTIVADVFGAPSGVVPDCAGPASEIKALNFEMRRRFDADPRARALFECAIAAAGLETATAYRDRLILRVSAPDATLAADPAVTLPAHRDTWASGFLCQINWWLPVFPLLPGNTAILYPQYWATPVENDARGWDWRRMKHDPAYPPLPTARRELPESEAVPLLLEPGEIAAFSGAHLHASRPNRSGVPRFSADTRTVDPRHMASRLGAPDVDHAPGQYAPSWFAKFETGEKLILDAADPAATGAAPEQASAPSPHPSPASAG